MYFFSPGICQYHVFGVFFFFYIFDWFTSFYCGIVHDSWFTTVLTILPIHRYLGCQLRVVTNKAAVNIHSSWVHVWIFINFLEKYQEVEFAVWMVSVWPLEELPHYFPIFTCPPVMWQFGFSTSSSLTWLFQSSIWLLVAIQ